MEKEIIDLAIGHSKEFEEENIVREEHDTWMVLEGIHKKMYGVLSDETKELEVDENLAKIEQICLEREVLSQIAPQFIYMIVLTEVEEINEEILKKVIQIEENEFFCKKYVLYYTKEELEQLKEWMKGKEELSLNKIINQEENVAILEEAEGYPPKAALNLLFRVIIKCPFLKYKFENKGFKSFEEELAEIIQKTRKYKKEILEYKENIFDKATSENLDHLAEQYISSFFKEEEN